MVQEVYATHPQVREACNLALSDHISGLEFDIEAAKKLYAPDAAWSAESVAQFIIAVVQGSFILVKAQQGTGAAIASLLHLKTYLGALFGSNHRHNNKHHQGESR
jgi:TetR/AcrR family transcriptional repressor of nem operon